MPDPNPPPRRHNRAAAELTDHDLSAEARRAKAVRAVFKADGEETENRYAVSEWWLDPKKPGPGAHKHDENEELFYVLEGVASMLVGEQWISAERTFLRIPAGVMHDFENRTDAPIGLLKSSCPAASNR